MKKRAPGSYGFTTSTADPFAARVAQEAKPADQFILATSKNTFTGQHALTVLVRSDVLPSKKAGLSLLGITTSRKRWGVPLTGTGFRALTVETPHVKKTVNIVKNEISRIKNYATDRHVRVVVESL